MRDGFPSGDRYGSVHPTWHAEDASAKAKAVSDLLRYGGVQPKVVVDVGCGTGDVLRLLAQEFEELWPHAHYEGWDIAKAAIRQARTFEGGHLHFVHGDFLTSEREAHLLLCLDVFEHVEDDIRFLQALASLSLIHI